MWTGAEPLLPGGGGDLPLPPVLHPQHLPGGGALHLLLLDVEVLLGGGEGEEGEKQEEEVRHPE